MKRPDIEAIEKREAWEERHKAWEEDTGGKMDKELVWKTVKVFVVWLWVVGFIAAFCYAGVVLKDVEAMADVFVYGVSIPIAIFGGVWMSWLTMWLCQSLWDWLWEKIK